MRKTNQKKQVLENAGPNHYCTLKQNLVEMIKNELILQGVEIDKWIAYKVIIRCEVCHQYVVNCYNLDNNFIGKCSEITNKCLIYHYYYYCYRSHKFKKQFGSFMGNDWIEYDPKDEISTSLYYAKLYNFVKIINDNIVKNFADILQKSES